MHGLKNLLSREPLRAAEGRRNTALQYHCVATCFAYLYDYESLMEQTKVFKGPVELRHFLVASGIVPFLLDVVKLKAPKGLCETQRPGWQWSCVRGYALLCLRVLCSSTSDDMPIPTGHEYSRRAAVTLCNEGGVHWMLGVLQKNIWNVVTTSHVISLLKQILDCLPIAADAMLQGNALYYFAHLFGTGTLDRKVDALYLDGAMLEEKTLLALPIFDNEMVSVNSLSLEDVMTRARCHATLVRQLSATIVSKLICHSDLSRQHALSLPGPVSCMKAVVACLRKPYTPNYASGRGVVKSASTLLLAVFGGSHSMAHDFLHGNSLTGLLRRWLLAPYRWPVEDLLTLIRQILEGRRRECSCFQKIECFPPILEACSLYLYSANRDIQRNAHYIVTELCQSSPRCLHHLLSLDILSPKLYSSKVVPLMEHGPTKSGHGTVQKFPVPDDPEWLNKDDQLERACRSAGQRTMVKLLARGEEHHRSGNSADAITCFSAALLSPGRYDYRHVAALLQRAEAYLATERFEKAIMDATRVIAFDFDATYSLDVLRALYARATAFRSLGRIFEAYNDIMRCVDDDPSDEKFQKFAHEIKFQWKKVCTQEMERQQTASGTPARSCTKCKERKSSMPICARCRAPYCSVKCQREHWSQHKKNCLPITQRGKSA